MVREGKTLHPQVSLVEHHGRGLVPAFTAGGFIKPERVTLIEHGVYRDCLTGARSAKEYGAAVNAGSEHPGSLDMAPGELSPQETLSRLDNGLYLNNLWYCNFSERNDCRITGMTRFACFWVEHGRIGAPLEVMRFDESVYSMLGKHLLGLTREREFIFDSDTYEKRSSASYLLPGALVEGMSFTL
jgi:predicted Zn-dependent protease